MKDHELALDAILDATSRPIGYRPVFPPGERPLFEGLLPDVQIVRTVGILGTVRVNRSLFLKNLQQAEKDLIALHCLASLVGQRPTCMVHLQMSYDVTAILQVAQACYLIHPDMTPAARMAYLQKVKQIPPARAAFAVFEQRDMVMACEVIDKYLSGNSTFILSAGDGGDTRPWLQALLTRIGFSLFLSRDEVLIGAKRPYHEIIDIVNQPYGEPRQTRINEFFDRLKADATRSRSARSPRSSLSSPSNLYLELRKLTRIARSRRLGHLFAILLMPAYSRMDTSEQKNMTYRAMLPALVAGTDEFLKSHQWRSSSDQTPFSNGRVVPWDRISGQPFYFESNPEYVTIYSSVSWEADNEESPDPYETFQGTIITFPIAWANHKVVTFESQHQPDPEMAPTLRWSLIACLAVVATTAVSYPLWLPHWQRRRMAGASTFEEDDIGDSGEE